MEIGEGTSSSVTTRSEKIKAGQLVLIRVPRGDIKSVKVEKDSTVTLGKAGSFHANELIGEPYGLTYEILDKKLKRLPPRTIEEVDDTDATNELINDGMFVQPLTLQEIEALKLAGAHSSEIIKKQIEQHANYSLKTEYSKEKYKKRKEAKYSKSFSTIEPTLFNVNEYWFNKDQNRLRDIRPDSLSQILNAASVRPGGKYIVVDEASGILVSGVLERLGGTGRLFGICDLESTPAYPVATNMNFDKSIVDPVLVTLNWATVQEEYTPLLSTDPPETSQSEKHRSRINKRKAFSDSLQAQREELFAGEFDGLIVSTEYDPYSILEMLSSYLAGSASIVMHSPHVQVLVDLQMKMKQLGCYLSPNVTETWTRRYQVLPGRTHPEMTVSGSGGAILQAYKVHDNPDALSVAARRQRKKPKMDVGPEISTKPTPDPQGIEATSKAELVDSDMLDSTDAI